MIKVDFPSQGVGIISYTDSVHFDFMLNVHPESDRMRRATSQHLPQSDVVATCHTSVVSSSQRGGCVAARLQST